MMPGETPNIDDVSPEGSTEIHEPDTIFSVEVPRMINVDRIPESDWRAYVEAQLQALSLAMDSIIKFHDKRILEMASVVEQLRGIWMRALGEFQDQKKYSLFGLRAVRVLEKFWNIENAEKDKEVVTGQTAQKTEE
jgi:hypothetical protein